MKLEPIREELSSLDWLTEKVIGSTVKGRYCVFSHVMFGSADIEKSCSFYDALFAPLKITRRLKTDEFASWVQSAPNSPQFFVCLPLNEANASVGNGSMVAFEADSIESVNTAYNAGMANGGADEGPPGPRPHYGEGYYGAYLRDPDGNKVHLVYRASI